jgi:hypothetical protein
LCSLYILLEICSEYNDNTGNWFFINFICKYYTQYRENIVCLQFVSENNGLELDEIYTIVKYAFG